MATTAEKKARLARIEKLIGISSTANDGQVTNFDQEALRREKAKLEQELKLRKRRPRIFGVTGFGG